MFDYKKEKKAPENSGLTVAEIKQQFICSLVKEAQW